MIIFNNLTLNQSIYQELEENGYALVDFLTESEVQSLINFDKKHSLTNDIVNPGMSFSMGTSEVLYRQLINQEITSFFVFKLAALFSNIE